MRLTKEQLRDKKVKWKEKQKVRRERKIQINQTVDEILNTITETVNSQNYHEVWQGIMSKISDNKTKAIFTEKFQILLKDSKIRYDPNKLFFKYKKSKK